MVLVHQCVSVCGALLAIDLGEEHARLVSVVARFAALLFEDLGVPIVVELHGGPLMRATRLFGQGKDDGSRTDGARGLALGGPPATTEGSAPQEADGKAE